MYIETLRTPHPSLAPPDERVALVEAAGLGEAPAYIAHAPNRDTAIQEVASYIGQRVRASLRFPVKDDDAQEIKGTTFDTLRQVQITNCLGYTVVGSECMDTAGIEHYIGFANGHSFLLRPTADGERFALDDLLSPHFNQDMTPYIYRNNPPALAREVQGPAQCRGVAMLDTLGLASAVRGDISELTQEHPWLTVAKSAIAPEQARSPVQERAKYFGNFICVMSVFASETGRDTLQNYATFQKAVAQKNLTVATDSLSQLRGLYPEIDARSSHQEIHRLVTDLCLLGEFTAAVLAIDDYCASFSVSQDARLKGLEGDLLRKVSEISNDPSTTIKSRRAYVEALNRTRCAGYSTSMYAGKIASLNRLAGGEYYEGAYE